MKDEVLDFIKNNINKTVRAACTGEGTLLTTPYPYITPCVSDNFQEMYYWDTYFANKAFLIFERIKDVENVLRNFDYFVKTYGKIPNGNRTGFLNRSQPPFFGLMISDLLKTGKTGLTMAEAFAMLEREYCFWDGKRSSENGLNHYSCDDSDEVCVNRFGKPGTSMYEQRLGISFERRPDNCRSILAECESGWDFSPRFPEGCIYYNAVDLNCLLYADELLLSEWATDCEKKELYKMQAQKRKTTMDKTMLAEDGIYYDYDYKTKTRSMNINCANLFPFFVGLSENQVAFDKIIAELEREHGVVAALTDRRVYQWAEPNGWACLTYIAVSAAQKLGRKDVAERLADKYIKAIGNIFSKTGRLWEKYNVETGDLDVVAEYGQLEMLGWTAGVYVALAAFRKTGTLF